MPEGCLPGGHQDVSSPVPPPLTIFFKGKPALPGLAAYHFSPPPTLRPFRGCSPRAWHPRMSLSSPEPRDEAIATMLPMLYFFTFSLHCTTRSLARPQPLSLTLTPWDWVTSYDGLALPASGLSALDGGHVFQNK